MRRTSPTRTRGESVGLLCALSASGATCSMFRSASKEEAAPRPDDSGVHVAVMKTIAEAVRQLLAQGARWTSQRAEPNA
jgi:hypothetical protein